MRFFNAIAHSIYYITARRDNRPRARAPRSVWVLPRPQMWFQQLLNDHALDHWWNLNLTLSYLISNSSVDFICLSLRSASRLVILSWGT